MPYKDKIKNQEYQRDWSRNKFSSEEEKNKRRKYMRDYERRLREKVIKLLGGKCHYCDCNEFDALEINHKYGGGRKERPQNNRRGKSFYLAIIKGRRTKEDLELTCRVCNAWHYLVKLKGVKSNWKIEWIPPPPKI